MNRKKPIKLIEAQDATEDLYEKVHGPPYMPLLKRVVALPPRDENPVVFMEITTSGGSQRLKGGLTQPTTLGRLYFELRNDLVPMACMNFMTLITGVNGVGLRDGVRYHYLGE